MNASQL